GTFSDQTLAGDPAPGRCVPGAGQPRPCRRMPRPATPHTGGRAPAAPWRRGRARTTSDTPPM
ncbi:MAG: hypothetical protein AVDCRST_MAG49-2643, partial [uncultured Thermomicrobiales bacterium]